MPLIKKRKRLSAMPTDGAMAAWNASWRRSRPRLPDVHPLTRRHARRQSRPDLPVCQKAALDKAWADDIKPCEMRDDVSYLPRTPAVRLAAYEGNCFRYRELGSALFDRIDGKTDGTRWYYDELARKRRDHECREVGAPRLSTLQAKRIQSPRCPNGCHVLV